MHLEDIPYITPRIFEKNKHPSICKIITFRRREFPSVVQLCYPAELFLNLNKIERFENVSFFRYKQLFIISNGFFAYSADSAGFHGTGWRGFALKCSLVLLFEKRLVDAVINKVPGEQFV